MKARHPVGLFCGRDICENHFPPHQLDVKMLFLAISLITLDELPEDFQRIARAYQPEHPNPGPFWAVIFNGKILAIYLDPKEAFQKMLAVKLAFEQGEEPKRQEYRDVATPKRLLEQKMKKDRQEGDGGTQP